MDFFTRFITALTELHPIHPMVVHFPIALTGAGFLFIVLAYWWNNQSLEQAAYANMILATLGTLAAGITGMMDNVKNYVGEAPNASAKVILALLLLLLTAGTSITRYRNPHLFQTANRFAHIAAYGVSFFIAFILAFLGGVILYGF